MDILVLFVIALLISIVVEGILGLVVITKISLNISTFTSTQLQDNLTGGDEENHSKGLYIFGFYSNRSTYRNGFHYFLGKNITESTKMAREYQKTVNSENKNLPAYQIGMDFTGDHHEILKRQIKPGRLQL